MTQKYVKIKWGGRILEGFLLDRPAMLDEGYIVIKLNNGYNIGLDESKCDFLEEKKVKRDNNEITSENVTDDFDVTVISTGGTISSKVDYLTGGVDTKMSANDFIDMIPDLKKYGDLNAEIMPNIMSEDINFKYWKKLANSIYNNVKNNPVVVTHGTDTMHYSSSLMNFLVQGGDYPRIFTGAQKSIDRGSSDAFMNFKSSIYSSLNIRSNESLICMHGSINDDYCSLHHGTRARKMHSSRRDAFQSINSEPVARVFPNKEKIEVLSDDIYHDKDLEKHLHFDEKVAIQYIYPELDENIFDYYLENDFNGVILMGTGLGHVPIKNYNIINKIKELEENGIITCVTSQTINGSVNPNVYANLRKLSKHSLFLKDMTPETAYLKLSWLLGNKNLSSDDVRNEMLNNYSNEISDRRLR